MLLIVFTSITECMYHGPEFDLILNSSLLVPKLFFPISVELQWPLVSNVRGLSRSRTSKVYLETVQSLTSVGAGKGSYDQEKGRLTSFLFTFKTIDDNLRKYGQLFLFLQIAEVAAQAYCLVC